MYHTGSSNNVLDFETKGTVVPLRVGPKSYTYGCFVNLLELFRTCTVEKKKGKEGSNDGDGDDGGDMEAFLDACEEDEDNDDDGEDDVGFDFYNNTMEGEDYDVNSHDKEEDEKYLQREKQVREASMMSDRQALDALTSALLERKNGYVLLGDRLQCALDGDDKGERFCAYLVQSELQILDFYIHASALIRSKLEVARIEDHSSQQSILNSTCSIEASINMVPTARFDATQFITADEDNEQDIKLRHNQALELMNAFCQIRYPSLLL